MQYLPVIESTVGYYSVYQYLPYNRISELFLHLSNLPISQVSKANLLTRIPEMVQPVFDTIQNAFATSKTAVGSDEKELAIVYN